MIAESGDMFGEFDFISDENQIENEGKRRFTVKTATDCEFLALSKDDLCKIDMDFPSVTTKLLHEGSSRLSILERLRFEAEEICNEKDNYWKGLTFVMNSPDQKRYTSKLREIDEEIREEEGKSDGKEASGDISVSSIEKEILHTHDTEIYNNPLKMKQNGSLQDLGTPIRNIVSQAVTEAFKNQLEFTKNPFLLRHSPSMVNIEKNNDRLHKTITQMQSNLLQFSDTLNKLHQKFELFNSNQDTVKDASANAVNEVKKLLSSFAVKRAKTTPHEKFKDVMNDVSDPLEEVKSECEIVQLLNDSDREKYVKIKTPPFKYRKNISKFPTDSKVHTDSSNKRSSDIKRHHMVFSDSEIEPDEARLNNSESLCKIASERYR